MSEPAKELVYICDNPYCRTVIRQKEERCPVCRKASLSPLDSSIPHGWVASSYGDTRICAICRNHYDHSLHKEPGASFLDDGTDGGKTMGPYDEC